MERGTSKSLQLSWILAAVIFVGPSLLMGMETQAGAVSVCHIPPGNPDNAHRIEVGQRAVNTHLRHGDEVFESDECEIGIGACLQEGQNVCTSEGIVCDAVPLEPGEETNDAGTCADTIDNDCDGFIDEQDPDCDPDPLGCPCADQVNLSATEIFEIFLASAAQPLELQCLDNVNGTLLRDVDTTDIQSSFLVNGTPLRGGECQYRVRTPQVTLDSGTIGGLTSAQVEACRQDVRSAEAIACQ
jgi:hypothetical protein